VQRDAPKLLWIWPTLAVLFVALAAVALVVANVDSLTVWVAERSTTQTATEYARPSTVSDIRQAGWFVGILFLFVSAIFVIVGRAVRASAVETDGDTEQLARTLGDALGGSRGVFDQTSFTFDVRDDEDAARAVQQAFGGLRLSGSGASIDAQLEKLAELHRQGALSDSEFEAAKKRVLGG
jgi:hypothetical protein